MSSPISSPTYAADNSPTKFPFTSTSFSIIPANVYVGKTYEFFATYILVAIYYLIVIINLILY